MKKLLWLVVWLLGLMLGCTPERVIIRQAPLDPIVVQKGDLEYELRFTNPVCAEYAYKEPIPNESGEFVRAKPKNVFCTMEDEISAGARPESVQSKLLEWIRDPGTEEIFFAFLSFSDAVMRDALCESVKSRGVRVTFVLDAKTDLSYSKDLVQCNPDLVRYVVRGHTGGLGYAHNKIFMVNPHTSGQLRFAFSSGNLSVGTTLHHENWNFLTVPVMSHIAQAHLCMINGMMNAGRSKASYAQYIRSCRARIVAPEEQDIRVFFAPAEGPRATRHLLKGIEIARSISIAAHRFSYNKMLAALQVRLSDPTPPPIRLVLDDDIYWVGTTGERVGHNWGNEYRNTKALTDRGADVRYLETNHYDGLLQHNKFLIFDDRALFTGAGNLTGTGFTENFENYYWIEFPEVIQGYKDQYEHLWGTLGTSVARMPIRDELPVVPKPPLYPRPKP